MAYVDGMVCAAPTANRERYREHAEGIASLFKEHGALEFVQCWGDDVPDGERTSFPLAVQCRADETVVFAWALWPSREARDEAMPKLVADDRMGPGDSFDGKRMIFGGFEVIVNR